MPESKQSPAAIQTREPYPKPGQFYDQITGDEDARVCKDIPEAACRHLPRNFFAYLVDMASQDTRSAYVAVRNTVIGAAMLAGGGVGMFADLFRISTVIALLSVVSLLAGLYIARIPDASG